MKSDMVRVEIIANRSTESDLFERLSAHNVAKQHTIVPVVHGIGYSGPRRGDHTWPEENFLVIVYCDKEEAAIINSVVEGIQAEFPEEGVSIFSVSA